MLPYIEFNHLNLKNYRYRLIAMETIKQLEKKNIKPCNL